MKFRTHLMPALALILTLGLIPQEGRSADAFVYGFEDMPLMPGLSQVAGNSVLFDTPQGRIVQASAIGAVKSADVLKFYAETLPQLGWSSVSKGEFQREGEMLTLEFKDAPPNLEVRFFVEPVKSP